MGMRGPSGLQGPPGSSGQARAVGTLERGDLQCPQALLAPLASLPQPPAPVGPPYTRISQPEDLFLSNTFTETSSHWPPGPAGQVCVVLLLIPQVKQSRFPSRLTTVKALTFQNTSFHPVVRVKVLPIQRLELLTQVT